MTNGWEPDGRTIKEVLADLKKDYYDSMSGPLTHTTPFIVGPKAAKILEKAGYTIKQWEDRN